MNKNFLWFLIVVVILGSFGVYAYTKNRAPSGPSKYDEFAKCLTDKGFVMYGAYWCSHCQNQKAMFGSAFQYIRYVECPQNTAMCTEKGVKGYPTWLYGDNQKLEGEVRLEKLSELSSCPLPQ